MKNLQKVVVVAPTFNEKSNLEKVVKLILEQNDRIDGFDIEVLVADSHSPDGTGEIAARLAKQNPKVHYLDIQERGLGLAIVSGYEYATKKLNADILMQIDADLQHDPNEIPLFLNKIQDGFEYVQGSRFAKGGKNEIPLSRQIFSWGSSVICRMLTGIWEVSDFGPSYKAYTRDLYERMNWDAIPWAGTTFLIQPAAVVEAKRANAKMVEVPIHFRKRGADRSKNEVLNYVFDIIGYGLEVRLSKWGIKAPVLYWTRKSKTFIKFGIVGLTGTIVDFVFYNIFISKLGLPPATSKAFSTEIAIFNNFTFNNIWTFKKRKTKNPLWKKFLIFNAVSFGGLAMSVGIIKIMHLLYGDGIWRLGLIHLQYYNLYFFATIPFVMTWNFLVNHFVTWKHEEE